MTATQVLTSTPRLLLRGPHRLRDVTRFVFANTGSTVAAIGLSADDARANLRLRPFGPGKTTELLARTPEDLPHEIWAIAEGIGHLELTREPVIRP